MKTPYKEEVDRLKKEHKENQNSYIAEIRKRPKVCGLALYRKREVWSNFQKKMTEYKTCFYVEEIGFNPSLYYSSCHPRFTEDRTKCKKFTVEEAVAEARALPFEVTVIWL